MKESLLSVELCQELVKRGLVLDTQHYWFFDHILNKWLNYTKNAVELFQLDKSLVLPAPSAEELKDSMAIYIIRKNDYKNYHNRSNRIVGGYRFGYFCEEDNLLDYSESLTESDAIALQLIALLDADILKIENNHIIQV